MEPCLARELWKCFLVVFLLPPYTVGSDSSVNGSTNTGPEEGNVSCIVPAYSQPLFEVNATNENVRLLLTEGMCYLACLTQYEELTSSAIDIYPTWPYIVVNEEHTCSSRIAEIHECTRGCSLWYSQHHSGKPFTGESSCSFSCQGDCRRECGGEVCVNPDTIDRWITRTGCLINCKVLPPCLVGCLVGQFIVDENNETLAPISPLAPPTLIHLNSSSYHDNRGLFQINLTEAVSGRISRAENFTWYGFLFRIHDLVTDNVTFIWQHDPREPLDLSSHICRDVNVSMAAVNRHGPSEFSEEVHLFISEDPRRIPNAPVNVQIFDSRDERLGFFPYVVLNVTWQSPEVEKYLLYYEIYLEKITPSTGLDGCEANASVITSIAVQLVPEGTHSALIEATESLGDPLMGRTYRVKVFSVGEDGNRSTCVMYTSRTLNDYRQEILEYNCDSDVTLREGGSEPVPYFLYHFSWTLAPNVGYGNFTRGFNISGYTPVALERNIIINHPLDMFNHPVEVNSMVNKTEYNYTEDRYSNSVRVSLDGESIKQIIFTLNIVWNMLEIPSFMDPMECEFNSSSPPPSEVRNFTVVYAAQLSPGTVLVEATWMTPLDANGVLFDYILCLWKQPIEPGSMGVTTDSCESIESDSTSVNTTLTYEPISFTGTMYIQIQPSNTIRSGLWSDPHPVVILAGSTPQGTNEVMTMEGDPNSETSRLHGGEIAAIVVSLLLPFILVICIGFLIYFLRNQRRKQRLMNLADAMPHFVPMLRTSNASTISTEKSFVADLEFLNKVIKDEWELCPTDITIDDMLGEGAFGEVYKGYLKGPISNPKIKPEFRNMLHIPVAIKLLKDTIKGSERRDFISEMEMMKKVTEGHNPHVVSMLGCVATQEPLCLITEFVEYGDLLTYLRSSRQLYVTGLAGAAADPYIKLGKLKPADLPSFSYQIAAGMAYLSDIGIVHRDLACRNVLVGTDKAMKITDFGLSRETEDMYIQKSTGRVPYKWMALESILAREFTSASDVWSFGIVLWEIGTIGGVPYPGVNNMDLVPYLKNGNRMKIPDGCPNNIYEIMLSCWVEDPSLRPTFSDLTAKFNDILLSIQPESYVDFNNINLEQSCYLEDDDFHLDFTEDDNDLPPIGNNFLDILNIHDRRTSAPPVPTSQSFLDQRRISTPTTKTELNVPKRLNLLDKIKNKLFSFEEDEANSSDVDNVSASNLNISMESLNRYVTSPTASTIMDDRI